MKTEEAINESILTKQRILEDKQLLKRSRLLQKPVQKLFAMAIKYYSAVMEAALRMRNIWPPNSPVGLTMTGIHFLRRHCMSILPI